ncbi:MAG: hypothetical protein FJY09_00845 [Chlorobi bacterium]|nr:hypothetical protein [Chlorobiota bacterium]
MSIARQEHELHGILTELIKLPVETEWVETHKTGTNRHKKHLFGIKHHQCRYRCHDETVGSRARKYLPWWA